MYSNVGKGSVHLFVLLQTDNYPDVVYPALVKSELYYFYYGTYLLLGILLFTPYLLAIIASHYWNYHKMVVKKERKRQREWLVKAWMLLGTTMQGEDKCPSHAHLQLPSSHAHRELFSGQSCFCQTIQNSETQGLVLHN